jgi:chromate transporter
MDPDRSSLSELAKIFLRLGATSFGGPAAHIAIMEDEFVRRRHWLSHEEFLDLVSACNLIPGPNSTEMAIHLGLLRGGWPGFLVAGISFIAPAMGIVMGLGWAYHLYGSLPWALGILHGVEPVVVAVVIQAVWSLGRSALRSWSLGAVFAVCLAAALAGMDELVILAAAGLGLILARAASDGRARLGALALSGAAALPALSPASAKAAPTASALFWIFLKAGACLFGSGYVLLAFLRHDLVLAHGWMTEAQLLDATAVGQVTPGPVFTTATFIGYTLAGPGAAVACTVAIFLPAFFFVALSAPWIVKARRSKPASAFLDGVNAASLALMAGVALTLFRSVSGSIEAMALVVLSAAILLRYRLNVTWLLAGGALLGLLGLI